MQELSKGVCISIYSASSKPARQFLLAFTLLLLLVENLKEHVLPVTQTSVIEGFAGNVPNLTGASSTFVKGNYIYLVGTGDVLPILEVTLPGLPIPKDILTMTHVHKVALYDANGIAPTTPAIHCGIEIADLI